MPILAVLAVVFGTIWLAGPVPAPTPTPAPTVAPAPETTTTVVKVDPLNQPSVPKADIKKDNTFGDVPNGDASSYLPPVDPSQLVQAVAPDGLGGKVNVVNTPTKNPWTPEQAVIYAAGQIKHPDKNYYQLCAHFVSWVYGYYGIGFSSAKTAGNAMPAKYRHKDVYNAPLGALIFFVGNDTGPWGHVVLSNGDGRVYSNDISVKGGISLVDLHIFKQRWGMSPSFWTEPYFPAAFGRNPNPAPVVAPVSATPVVNLHNIRWAAKHRGDMPGVKRVRENLGLTRDTHFGRATLKRNAKFQKERGFLRQDGIPTCKSLTALGKQGPNKFLVKC